MTPETTPEPSLEARLEAVERRMAAADDAEAIRQCLYRYCRGIDRCDEAALRSAYWPDATDRHGPYAGSASGFIDWALPRRRGGARMVHLIGNVAIELHGAWAAVESYFQAFQIDRDAQSRPRETFLCGRYVDRFEQRSGGEWRIAARTVVYDWLHERAGPDGDEAARFGVRSPAGAPCPDDAWYALATAP